MNFLRNKFKKKYLKMFKQNNDHHFLNTSDSKFIQSITTLIFFTILALLIMDNDKVFAADANTLVKCYHPQACKEFVMRTPQVCKMIGGSLTPIKKKNKAR